MKIKIGLIFILISAFLCIFIVNHEVQFKNNSIKIPKKVITKRYKKIKVSEILNIIEKYKDVNVKEVQYNNKDAYINASTSGNIQNINNVINNFRKEKEVLEIKQIDIIKTPQNEKAEMKVFFKQYDEVN